MLLRRSTNYPKCQNARKGQTDPETKELCHRLLAAQTPEAPTAADDRKCRYLCPSVVAAAAAEHIYGRGGMTLFLHNASHEELKITAALDKINDWTVSFKNCNFAELVFRSRDDRLFSIPFTTLVNNVAVRTHLLFLVRYARCQLRLSPLSIFGRSVGCSALSAAKLPLCRCNASCLNSQRSLTHDRAINLQS